MKNKLKNVLPIALYIIFCLAVNAMRGYVEVATASLLKYITKSQVSVQYWQR